MNTFWLKIAGVAIAVGAIVVIASMFASDTSKAPKEPEEGFYDQAQKDRKNFLAEPKPVETNKEPPVNETKPPVETQPTTTQPPTQPTQPVQQNVQPVEPAQPKVLYFKPLDEIEKFEAEKKLNAAVPGRSVGRLQVGYKQLMVDPCRDIIRRWPDSYYAYQAKRLLADLPERFQRQYNVTEEEKDISMFEKQRPGTQPMTFSEQN